MKQAARRTAQGFDRIDLNWFGFFLLTLDAKSTLIVVVVVDAVVSMSSP